MEDLERLLREHEFLKGFSESHTRLLVSCAKNLRFKPGDFLMREGDEANTFFLIRVGHVTLEIHVPGKGAVQMESVGPGDVLGLAWLVPPYRVDLDARAVEPIVALAFDGACLRRQSRGGPRSRVRAHQAAVREDIAPSAARAPAAPRRVQGTMTADVARDPWIPEPMRILSTVRETADTFTLRLDAKSRASVFAPGQFNMVYLFGFGEVPISISGDPHDPQSMVHTIRAVGSVTSGMKALRRGDAVGIRGPYGRGWPLDEALGKDLLLVAGGLGIAPLRSVVYTALRHRARFRSVVLLYGARSPEDLVYRKEIARWSKSPRCERPRHGRPRGSRLVGPRRGGSGPARSRTRRCGCDGRDGLRSGGDDALHGAGAHAARRERRRAYSSRWRGT